MLRSNSRSFEMLVLALPLALVIFQAHERALALFVNERHSFKEEKAMQFSKNNYHIAHLECKTKFEIGEGPKLTHLLAD